MNLPPINLEVKEGGCKPKRGTTVLKLRDRLFTKECDHNSVVVDERARTLECEDCKAVIDPIQFLVEWAYKQRRLDHQGEQYRHLIQRYEEIEREKTRKKAIRQGQTVKEDRSFRSSGSKAWHLTRNIERRGGRRRMIYALCGTGLSFESYIIETSPAEPDVGVCERCSERREKKQT